MLYRCPDNFLYFAGKMAQRDLFKYRYEPIRGRGDQAIPVSLHLIAFPASVFYTIQQTAGAVAVTVPARTAQISSSS